MRRAVVTAALLLVPMAGQAASDAVATAEKALAAGEAEEVLLALMGRSDAGPPERVAGVLARAAALAIEKGDPLLGMQLCQMALGRVKAHADALVACVDASRAVQHYDPAEEYLATLRRTHPDDRRGLLREARLAHDQAEWKRAAAAARRTLEGRTLTDAHRAEARRIRDDSERELSDRAAAISRIESIEQAMAAARTAVPEGTGRTAAATPSTRAPQSDGVIVYTTPWCGYCKKAMAFLRRKKVPYVEKDIQADPGAVEELAQKALEAGVTPRGVPVIDVAGELMLGYSEAGLAKLLRKKGLLR